MRSLIFIVLFALVACNESSSENSLVSKKNESFGSAKQSIPEELSKPFSSFPENSVYEINVSDIEFLNEELPLTDDEKAALKEL